MAKRKIIKIDEEKCNGCGLCIPNCPEGALQIIDGKARLISDLFCDGLGTCIGHCPEGAISIEEREAEKYNERKAMENVIKQGKNVIKAHIEHLKAHGETEYLRQALDFLKERNIEVSYEAVHSTHMHTSSCPGSKMMDFTKKHKETKEHNPKPHFKISSELSSWPIQLKLVPSFAPYLKNVDLLIAADCAPFAYANFHQDFLKGKVLLIGCPKLDDAEFYKEKLTQILKDNTINSITCVHMEVPCCFGLVHIVKEALSLSGRKIPLKETTIGVKGDIK